MNKKNWNSTLQNIRKALQDTVSKITDKEILLELENADTGNEEETLKYLKDFNVLKSIEENYQIEILIGFKGNWGRFFDREQANESDMLRVTEQLSKTTKEVFSRLGGTLKMNVFNVADQSKSVNLLNLQAYYLSTWTISNGNDSEDEPVELALVISAPSEDIEAYYRDEMKDAPALDSPTFAQIAEEMVQVQFSKPKTGEHTVDNNSDKDQKTQNGSAVEFEPFDKSYNVKNEREIRNIDLLKDVEMEVSVELGRRKMPLGKVLQLVKGSVIELEKLAGEPVDLLVNGRYIASGEVIVIDEHFGLRITDLLAAHNYMRAGA